MAKREIEIMEVKEDPPNDMALGFMIDVRSKIDDYVMLMVYFSEEFMREYFGIPWYKDLPREEASLIRTHYDDFEKWAIAKVEEWLRKRPEETKLFIDYETDAGWAEKVQKGEIEIKSKKEKDRLYIFER